MRRKRPEIETRLDHRQWTFASAVLSKPERRRFVGAFLVAALLILAGALKSKGTELTPETLKAWDAYVQTQNARVAQYSITTPFLWSEQSPDRLRRLHNGNIVVAPFGENPHRVPQGLIHHWVGAVFLPSARLNDVLSVVRNYGRYKDFYAPNIVESRLVRRTETEDTFSLRMLNKSVIGKFALDTDFQDSYKQLDERKWYSTSYTTRVREVESYGVADEHQVPADRGRGLIWRLYSIFRFEDRDGGVYASSWKRLLLAGISREHSDCSSIPSYGAPPEARCVSRFRRRKEQYSKQLAFRKTTRMTKRQQNRPLLLTYRRLQFEAD